MTKESEKTQVEGTLLSFLMSSLNIELVHIILSAVSERTVGTAKSKNNFKVYNDYDHKSCNEFVLDSIEIEDKDNWDVAQVTNNQDMRRLTEGRRETLKAVSLDRKLVINEDIHVIEYAPDVFAFLREKDGFTNEILRDSLNPEKNKQMVFKAGESQGKSGSFFFFSQDQKFIIKTMTDSDFNAFQRI